MARFRRRGPPRHLERVLFINHKEDQILDSRLHHLTLESRLKLMELERESIKVRTELKNSRKKSVTVNEAISSGLVPQEDAIYLLGGQHPLTPLEKTWTETEEWKARRQSLQPVDVRRASAPHREGQGHTQEASRRPGLSRSSSTMGGHHGTRTVKNNQFSRQPTILENEEFDSKRPPDRDNSSLRDDTVGTYVLGEFEKISQVVPDILRALAKKKEKQQEADELQRIKELKNDVVVDLDNILEYEPDMNKVRKTVRSVKKLRHRMAISKRLENPRQQKSLDEMIKDKAESLGDNDQYTDGTCALMKRRLEKKRRESNPFVLGPPLLQRSQSMLNMGSDVPAATGMSRRPSMMSDSRMRRASTVPVLPGDLSRGSTMVNMGSSGRLNANAEDGDGSAFIDEDLLMNRQRVMKEVDKYRSLQNKVHGFIDSTLPYRTNHFIEGSVFY